MSTAIAPSPDLTISAALADADDALGRAMDFVPETLTTWEGRAIDELAQTCRSLQIALATLVAAVRATPPAMPSTVTRLTPDGQFPALWFDRGSGALYRHMEDYDGHRVLRCHIPGNDVILRGQEAKALLAHLASLAGGAV